MKAIFLTAIFTLSISIPALAENPQLQEVNFSDCSGGGFGVIAGASHLFCREVRYYKDGTLQTRVFPRGYRAKLTTLEGGMIAALTGADPKRTSISCIIPNFDLEKGFSGLVGGIGAAMGDGRGGDISKVWGRRVSCVPSLAGGTMGSKIYLNLGVLRVPAQ